MYWMRKYHSGNCRRCAQLCIVFTLKRGLKPSNILMRNQRKGPGIKVKLCDFGESWGNIVLATNYKKDTHTTSIKSYKCIEIKT